MLSKNAKHSQSKHLLPIKKEQKRSYYEKKNCGGGSFHQRKLKTRIKFAGMALLFLFTITCSMTSLILAVLTADVGSSFSIFYDASHKLYLGDITCSVENAQIFYLWKYYLVGDVETADVLDFGVSQNCGALDKTIKFLPGQNIYLACYLDETPSTGYNRASITISANGEGFTMQSAVVLDTNVETFSSSVFKQNLNNANWVVAEYNKYEFSRNDDGFLLLKLTFEDSIRDFSLDFNLECIADKGAVLPSFNVLKIRKDR